MNEYFIALLVICSAYAILKGGAPEKIGATVYALSCVATYALLEVSQILWRSIEIGVFVIDVTMFVFFCALAMRADRFWPIWVSAFLGLGVLGHLARWAGPGVVPWAYAVTLTIWSYPIAVTFALGTWRHQQRLALHGVDPSWSTSSARSDPARRPGPTG